jgi:hypothetical protein
MPPYLAVYMWERVEQEVIKMGITKRFATEDYVTTALDEKITAPSTALIGQTIVVKAVDENGKPIEWEYTNVINESVSSNTDYATYRIRNVALLSAMPETMNNGDIALVYK